jgi:dynein intermediate chain
MEQRKAEIAAKRQRLAEIKRRNAERQQLSTTRRSQDISEVLFSSSQLPLSELCLTHPRAHQVSAPIPRAYNRESIESLVRDLVGERPSSTGGFRGSRPNSVLSTTESTAASEITSPLTPAYGIYTPNVLLRFVG